MGILRMILAFLKAFLARRAGFFVNFWLFSLVHRPLRPAGAKADSLEPQEVSDIIPVEAIDRENPRAG
jgi:hypothetical protein